VRRLVRGLAPADAAALVERTLHAIAAPSAYESIMSAGNAAAPTGMSRALTAAECERRRA
jgi:hypothetical protein